MMLYCDYLLKVLKWECPFCDINKNYIVEKWKYFTVILARSPYSKDHLLIVPNRHLIRLSEITKEEQETLLPLITKWTKKLEKIHKEVNVLLRDWVANWVIWKSIDHLHIHLVPDRQVYSWTWWPGRKIFSDYMLAKKTAEFRNIIKWK
jgi:diadenosine tetraphosphate (Ap4A) HIT family hydrolase